MRAITVTDRDAGARGLTLTEIEHPKPSENDVVVEVHAAGFTTGELDWPGTWTDRNGHDRTPSVPGHEVAGIVAELGYGTTGLTVGQRVFGLTDWTRNGSLAEYVAVEARNLAPLPASVDFVTAAALPVSGLTAWEALFDHGRLQVGQTVLVHGATGGVGSLAIQLARTAGARVIATGRTDHRDKALDLGADAFLDLRHDPWEKGEEADLVLDVIGGEIYMKSLEVLRPGGRIVTIPEPPAVRPQNGEAIFFIVEADRSRLTELAQRVSAGVLAPVVGAVRPLEETADAFVTRAAGRTIIEVRR
ncbi:NADP-dependent oxidoreductase [Actinoplanes sp. TRM 88003]|uniref:NADP-dependent oxidoreductase n=1 Tax=Paractinoplanes aksuensis TaxID=2939490 RepID=A0ABT1DUC1_9ACTN|nr:NADP-dependent oxidoreductase [Actinoplanes aksuensis]MCO8274138.1 NADP-dependent oxidoreductase [Actinoplanes aksuensis]